MSNRLPRRVSRTAAALPRRGARGFTIIEVMMAAAILVVGFMGMIQALTIGSEMMATARRQTLANQMITQEIEKLRLTDWSSLPPSGTSSLTPDASFTDAIAACGLTPSGITLSRTVTDLDVDADGTTDLKEITITLSWSKGATSASQAATYMRSMRAYFGKYGVNLNTQRA